MSKWWRNSTQAQKFVVFTFIGLFVLPFLTCCCIVMIAPELTPQEKQVMLIASQCGDKTPDEISDLYNMMNERYIHGQICDPICESSIQLLMPDVSMECLQAIHPAYFGK